ncbi:hypothetical protein D5018_16475 [Parashewanella curva]|uniref:Excisionase n=1 Tax=Parashewanella curva TaxID=2338552 RepID=A0A3L8PT91_9GAMM|nr:hypothetical protein [Parashewanella curva]RLV58615.1 hypothetical protein D5018_16475 [Parashewanella curva]
MQPKLMRASLWVQREFSKGSAPSHVTIRKWIQNGVIAGRMINGCAYVFDDQCAGIDSQVTKIVDDLMRL